MSFSPGLAAHPQLDSWVRIDAEDTVTLFTGKVELGQGIVDAIARIGADELDVSLGRVRVASVDTSRSPDEGGTSASVSVVDSGAAVRQAAAEARAQLLSLAAEALGVPVAELAVSDGVVSSPTGASVSYWELLGGATFDRVVTGEIAPKRHSLHRIVGGQLPRSGVAGLVCGTTLFVHDMAVPGMLHARVVRPALDASVDVQLPSSVDIVRDGRFVAVLSEREEHAVQAATALQVRRVSTTPTFTYEWRERLRSAPAESLLVVEGVPVDGALPRPLDTASSAVHARGSFSRPFLMHGSIGPSAALALLDGEMLTVWCSTQDAFALRDHVARLLELESEQVRVIHARGAGCYGHNGADDVGLEAALVARAVPGTPVLLKWTREDEHAHEPYGPAMAVEVSASLDESGALLGWDHQVWSNTHSGRPSGRGSTLLAGQEIAASQPPPPVSPNRGFHGGIHRNADPLYDIRERRIIKHLVREGGVRTSALRALGAYINVFAIESMIDELAAAAGVDPVEFRVAKLSDPRARDVVRAAAELAGWAQRDPGTEPEFGRGEGIGFARYKNSMGYCAVVAEVEVDDTTAVVAVTRLSIAADVGEIVSPEGVIAQLEGGAIQSTSWSLFEAVGFDGTVTATLDWDSYPILRFPDVPTVETVLIERPDEPYLGAGEISQGPTVAAISNAIYAAIGVRLRNTPFTPDQVRMAVGQQTAG